MVKSTIRQPIVARSPPKVKGRSLFTPVRKLFLKLDPSILGKRQRDIHDIHDIHEYSELDPVVDTPSSVVNSPPAARHVHNLQLGIALQNEDDDVVVITALDTVPFCCHEDLVTMDRPDLITVAQKLNDKLPAVLRIDLSATDTFIRNSIEVLVGLRHAPDAPKAERLKEPTDYLALNISPPSSPLARRSRFSDGYQSLTPRLAKLEEEEEEPERKKRRVSREAETPSTPTPVSRFQRSQSQHVKRDSPMPPRRLARSQSQRDGGQKLDSSFRFVTTTRPRYRSRRMVLPDADDGEMSSAVVGLRISCSSENMVV
ncbi:hypothetical protein C8J56DRAFT_939034 [Mycena floridula]|nr:hypothetical protein C8J56DRAFT_939034 [Mycena floridula]